MTIIAFAVAGLIASEPLTSVDVRSSPALQGVHSIAEQTGIDVVVSTPLGSRRLPALRGRMTPEAALGRWLAPAQARADRIGPGLYRIVAASPGRAAVSADSRLTEPVAVADVVVRARPARSPLDGAEGRVRLPPEALDLQTGRHAAAALSDLASTVDSTRQGSGRNKLFIRGVSDSAFSGPLQSTVGVYLGDFRIGAGAPHPDLALVDIQGVEVFEGPQSARFGTGSIGGVVRLIPTPPDPGATEGSLATGVQATRDGAAGFDASGVINAPIDDKTAWRVAAYSLRDGGGYGGAQADEAVSTIGLRASLIRRGEAWTVTGMIAVQDIQADDSRNRPLDEGAPTRRIAEPYESQIALTGVTAVRRAGGVRFLQSAILSRQTLDEKFDASPSPASPAAAARSQDSVMASSETRLEIIDGPVTASLGLSLAAGRLTAQRARDFPNDAAPMTRTRVTRDALEAGLYGEAAFEIGPDLRLAVGGRASAARIEYRTRTTDPAATGADQPDGKTLSLVPALTLRWRREPRPLEIFARLEQGVRPGGLDGSGGGFHAYEEDRLTYAELGVRTGGLRSDWSAEASFGRIDWRDVQADITTLGGDLVTDNIGDGVVRFFQAKASWRPVATLSLTGNLFLNDSRLRSQRLGVIVPDGDAIPNVASAGAYVGATWDVSPWFRLGTAARYVGRSRPGYGPGLETPQGGYLKLDLSARLGDDRKALTLDISNVLDEDAAEFGLGSPYQLSSPRISPLRPITARIGIFAAF